MQCFLIRCFREAGLWKESLGCLTNICVNSAALCLDDQRIAGVLCCVLKCLSVRLFKTKAEIWFSVKKKMDLLKLVRYMKGWVRINTQRWNTELFAFFCVAKCGIISGSTICITAVFIEKNQTPIFTSYADDTVIYSLTLPGTSHILLIQTTFWRPLCNSKQKQNEVFSKPKCLESSICHHSSGVLHWASTREFEWFTFNKSHVQQLVRRS